MTRHLHSPFIFKCEAQIVDIYGQRRGFRRFIFGKVAHTKQEALQLLLIWCSVAFSDYVFCWCENVEELLFQKFE